MIPQSHSEAYARRISVGNLIERVFQEDRGNSNPAIMKMNISSSMILLVSVLIIVAINFVSCGPDCGKTYRDQDCNVCCSAQRKRAVFIYGKCVCMGPSNARKDVANDQKMFYFNFKSHFEKMRAEE